MIRPKVGVAAFTKKHDSLTNVLITTAKVSNSNITDTENSIKVNAIWDTGATNCAISSEIAKKLNLIPISKTQTYTANGVALQNVYKINLSLPNNVLLNDVIVTEVPMISQADMLIGMSVINRGDFSVSNYNGKTILSFRIPSLADADYVELLRSQIPKTSTKIGRNEPCPCGSGKKYKQCCGK